MVSSARVMAACRRPTRRRQGRRWQGRPCRRPTGDSSPPRGHLATAEVGHSPVATEMSALLFDVVTHHRGERQWGPGHRHGRRIAWDGAHAGDGASRQVGHSTAPRCRGLHRRGSGRVGERRGGRTPRSGPTPDGRSSCMVGLTCPARRNRDHRTATAGRTQRETRGTSPSSEACPCIAIGDALKHNQTIGRSSHASTVCWGGEGPWHG